MKGFIRVASILLVAGAVAARADTHGVPAHRPPPDEYGQVVMDNFATTSGIAAVRFDHWLHRSEYTCRVCHVDLGFAMQAGATRVREVDNRHHQYCGACHDGKEAFAVAPSGYDAESQKVCVRCHAVGERVTPRPDFYTFTEGFPKTLYGNRIDWLAAQRRGQIKLKDTVPGVTRRRRPIRHQGETVFAARDLQMPEIVFSHPKHAVWVGCELCHPAIFPVEPGADKISMQAIFEGRYCGVCHGKVSFPLDFDCRLCHTRDVY